MDNRALVPQSDPFQMMERLDEEQVLDEIKGRALDALVYEIKQGGQFVTGLSLSGVREVARQMNRSGNARIGITDREPTITETDDYFEVKVFAQDPQNGGGYWGIKRQSKKYTDGRVNQFALEQALAKAQRNAMRGLIPEYFAKEMIDVFRNKKQVRVIEHGTTEQSKPSQEPTSSNGHTQRPADTDTVRGWLIAKQGKLIGRAVNDDQLDRMRGLLAGTLEEKLGSADKRHVLLAGLWDACEGSTKKMTAAQVGATLDWLALEKGTDGRYQDTANTGFAIQEAERIITDYQKSHGQAGLFS